MGASGIGERRAQRSGLSARLGIVLTFAGGQRSAVETVPSKPASEESSRHQPMTSACPEVVRYRRAEQTRSGVRAPSHQSVAQPAAQPVAARVLSPDLLSGLIVQDLKPYCPDLLSGTIIPDNKYELIVCTISPQRAVAKSRLLEARSPAATVPGCSPQQ